MKLILNNNVILYCDAIELPSKTNNAACWYKSAVLLHLLHGKTIPDKILTSVDIKKPLLNTCREKTLKKIGLKLINKTFKPNGAFNDAYELLKNQGPLQMVIAISTVDKEAKTGHEIIVIGYHKKKHELYYRDTDEPGFIFAVNVSTSSMKYNHICATPSTYRYYTYFKAKIRVLKLINKQFQEVQKTKYIHFHVMEFPPFYLELNKNQIEIQ